MPLEIRGAHALFNAECTISAGNTLRIGRDTALAYIGVERRT